MNASPSTAPPSSSSNRQARSRKARAEAGGKQVAVWLVPAAVKRLAVLQSRGETIAGAINRLLMDAKR